MGKSTKTKRSAEDAAPSSDAPAMEVDAVEEVDSEAPKAKKAKKEEGVEVKEAAVSAIAKPLAGKKMGKHVLKLVKKGESVFALSGG